MLRNGLIVSFLVVAIACSGPIRAQEDGGEEKMAAKVNPLPVGTAEAWGSRRTITPGDTAPVQAFSQPFPKPGVYTVQFNVKPVPGQQIISEALITWAIKSQHITRRVSIANGISVQGNAEGVTVDIIDKGAQNPINPFTYDVVTTVAKGTRPPSAVPPRLMGVEDQTVNTGGSVQVDIPQDSGANAIFVAIYSAVPILEGQVNIRQRFGAGVSLQENDPRPFEWVPLVPGADNILIQNIAGPPSFKVTVHFGIDG